MDFFCGNNVRNYCNSYLVNMKEEVEQLSDAEIVSCDFQEWATYLANKYSVVPVTIFENNIDKKLSETKVKKVNPFSGFAYESDFFEIDGVRVTFTIPYDGNPDLFALQPNSCILSRFSTNNFKRPYREECGSFTIDFDYTKKSSKIRAKKWLPLFKSSLKKSFAAIKR